jgi:hypothetical protein
VGKICRNCLSYIGVAQNCRSRILILDGRYLTISWLTGCLGKISGRSWLPALEIRNLVFRRGVAQALWILSFLSASGLWNPSVIVASQIHRLLVKLWLERADWSYLTACLLFLIDSSMLLEPVFDSQAFGFLDNCI